MDYKDLDEWQLRKLLKHSLISYEDNKRTSEIEKSQLELIKRALVRAMEKYKNSVSFDFEQWNTKKTSSSLFITYDGEIKLQTDGYNEWYDCKKFDAVVSSTICGKPFTFFFILKGVENSGGHQRNVKQEIGMYSKCIQKNKNEDAHFFFVMDGEYINKGIEKIDVCDKYDFSTIDTVENIIETFIIKNLK